VSIPFTPAGQSPTAGGTPEARATVSVGRYDDYASAQRAVDFLSDNGFPVEHVSIVGTDLRLIERVLGRMTVARATATGALSGAWFGLLIGLLLSIFTTSGWLVVLIVAVLVGAGWGAVFGAVAHAMTGGRRDFTSSSSLQAAHYDVVVASEHADEARTLLTKLSWRDAGT